jgi:hypothetical protein
MWSSPIKNWRNILALKDERTRPENWNYEMTLISLSKIKDSWDKTHQGLPMYDTWKRVKEEITAIGKWGDKQKCGVIGYQDNELTVIFQNYYPDRDVKTYDLTQNDLAVYFQGKLYFIGPFAYISLKRLIVQATCYQDYVFTHLPNLLVSAGHGVVKQSTFFKGQEGLHYSFCGDVGDKITFRDKAQWQPTFRAVKLTTDFWDSDAMTGGIFYKQIGGDVNAHIPTATKLDDLGQSSADWKDTSTLSFLGPGEMTAKEIENMAYRAYPNQKFVLPNELMEQPHLWDHTKIQFFFLNEIVYEADMTDLDIREGDPATDLPETSDYKNDPKNQKPSESETPKPQEPRSPRPDEKPLPPKFRVRLITGEITSERIAGFLFYTRKENLKGRDFEDLEAKWDVKGEEWWARTNEIHVKSIEQVKRLLNMIKERSSRAERPSWPLKGKEIAMFGMYFVNYSISEKGYEWDFQDREIRAHRFFRKKLQEASSEYQISKDFERSYYFSN